MRALALAVFVLAVSAAPVHASERQILADTATTYMPPLDRPRTAVFHYDSESQAAILILKFGRAKFSMGMTNPLQLPLHEPRDGVYHDDYTPLTEALRLGAIDVDTDDESAISMTFSFDW